MAGRKYTDFEKANQVCPVCNVTFSYHRKRKFCSDECSRSVHHPTLPKTAKCLSCKAEFVREAPSQIHCSAKCRRALALNKRKSKRRLWAKSDIACVACGSPFMPRQANAMYCSRRCMQRCWQKRHYSKVSPKMPWARLIKTLRRILARRVAQDRSEANARRLQAKLLARALGCRQCGAALPRRARLYCAPCSKAKAHDAKAASRDMGKRRLRSATVERVVRRRVLERDGWRCQICGCSTPKELSGKHKPNSPEMDHRIPASLGGPHSYANCQCTCRRCNLMKSNKSIIGQLPLLSHQ